MCHPNAQPSPPLGAAFPPPPAQRDAGSCFDAWVLSGGHCQITCGRCNCPGVCFCTDIPASPDFTCSQQAAWGKVRRRQGMLSRHEAVMAPA